MDYDIEFGNDGVSQGGCNRVNDADCVELRRFDASALDSILSDPDNCSSPEQVQEGARTVWFLCEGRDAGGWEMAWQEQGRTYVAWEWTADQDTALTTLGAFVQSLQPLTPSPAPTGGGTTVSQPRCSPGANMHALHIFKVTMTCLLSGQVFFDPDLRARSRCLVKLGVDALTTLIPAGKLAVIGKYADRFGAPAKALAAGLRKLGPKGIDAKFIDALDHAGAILHSLSGTRAAAEEFFAFVFTSHKALGKVGQLLAHSKLSGKIRAAQDGLDGFLKGVTGISDVQGCIAAFG